MRLDTLTNLDSKELLSKLDASSSKELAATKFSELKLPTKKSEKYRYFDIEPLMQKEYNTIGVNSGDIAESKAIVINDGSLVSKPNIDGLSVEVEEFNNIDSNHFDALYYLNHLVTKITIW